jgi:hypothetical protein
MLYQHNAHWHGEAALASLAVALAVEDHSSSIKSSYKQSVKPTDVLIHRQALHQHHQHHQQVKKLPEAELEGQAVQVDPAVKVAKAERM